MDEKLNQCRENVFCGNLAEMEQFFAAQNQDGISGADVMAALQAGLEDARLALHENHISIPEFLIALDVFRRGVTLVREKQPHLQVEAKSENIIIGVVEGDVHDLGKNIVAAVLDASGFSVIDLGKDVSRERLCGAMEKHNPAVVALSSMMSTSLINIEKIIHHIKMIYPPTPVLVGGASLDRDLALTLGADGYAESAFLALDEIDQLVTGNQHNS